MKKLSLLLAALMPVFFLISCDKPGKEPAKKISKEYVESGNSGPVLNKSYTWDKELLTSINVYNAAGEITGTSEFFYNKDKTVEKVVRTVKSGVDDELEMIYNVSYENNKMVVESYLYDELKTRFTYTYTDNKVTELEMTAINYFAKGSAPEFLYEPFKKFDGKPGKGSDYTLTYKFTYTGENITALTMTDGASTQNAEITYDNAFNPLYNVFDESCSLNYSQLSKNNIEETYLMGMPYNEFAYTYDEDNYPIRAELVGYGFAYIYEYTK